MRITLLALDGSAARAEEVLRARHPRAEVRAITRDEIERGALAGLRALRATRPDAFAVSTERLAWQRGQAALLLFGALAGARRLILLDAHGAAREESGARAVSLAPFRFSREAWAGAFALVRARRELSALERAAEEGAFPVLRAASPAGEPVRISFLRATPSAGTQPGGAASHVNGFIRGALELGARVALVSNDEIAGLDDPRVAVKIFGPSREGLTRGLFELRNGLLFTERAVAEIARDPPDLIYQRYARLNWTGARAARAARRPLFLEYNGSEVWIASHWDRGGLLSLLARAEALNLAAAARVFVVSEADRRNLTRAGVPAEKIVVNPNGVDARRFRPGAGGPEARRELGVGGDETLVGFVGSFGPWHGTAVLAEAVCRIRRGARVRFLFVGTGSERERAERIVRECGAGGRTIFTGAVAHARVPALLDACDVLASPHVWQKGEGEFFGSPTKLFEYMAAGKAIVASRLGQIGEVLEDGETALLVEPGDARAFCDAIMRLHESAELRARLGAAARAACVERHTWERNAARVLEAFASLGEQSASD